MSDTPPTNPPDDPAQLRKKLDDALKREKDKDEQLRRQGVMLTLHDAQLGHLNEAQRNALILSLPQDQEANAENLKAVATNLGFPSAPPSAPPAEPPAGQTPPAGEGDQNQPGDTSGQGQPPTVDPGTNFLTPAPGSSHPDPRVAASITGLTQQEHAHIMALRGGHDGGNFEEKVKGAKSKEEVLAAIRQFGGNAGLMLDSDLD